jgi:HAD superfamily phosphatase
MTAITFPTAKTLLLDMDGVLAEVSKSYRASIIATCHEYGATSITHDTISEWKTRGGCNNDWKLSHDLINTDPNGQKDLTYEQVVATFEKYYQGEGDTAGLCDLESLIPSKELLENLHQKCKAHGTGMAIVTGRPVKDCDKFLKLHGIDHLFDACVCMEDGPPKPDPFPVVRAVELLKVQTGKEVIMVGDTPDDVRAAIACGCRAIGVATPESVKVSSEEGRAHDTCALSVAMKECGADIVMKPGFEELLGLF